MTSHLFSDQASSYAQFRPIYPPELYNTIYDYLGSTEPFRSAIDIATGNGQAAVGLAEKFDKVLAFDVSANQLSQAAQHAKVQYRQGSAEDIDARDSSADLVTVAQAMHWFDLPSFFKEAHRVLRPGGVLAIWGGRRPEIVGNERAETVLEDLYSGTLGPYWNARIELVNSEYASVKLDEDLFEAEKRLQMPDHTDWSIDHLVGYLSTWSAHASYSRENPGNEDPLLAFRSKLLEAFDAKDGSEIVTLTWPNFLILAVVKK